MSYDFFNPSNLAFGKKITNAFDTLNKLADAADEAVDTAIFNAQRFVGIYQKNYSTPRPTRVDMACRTNELFDLLPNNISVRSLSVSESNKAFTIKVTYFDEVNARITQAEGSTTERSGYAITKKSISNQNMLQTIRFSKTNKTTQGEMLLFKYEILDDGSILMMGDVSTLDCTPLDFTQYRNITKGENIKLPHTATGYECVCVIGQNPNISVELNGTTLLESINSGYASRQFMTLFLRKDDVLSGSHIDKCFKIMYNT